MGGYNNMNYNLMSSVKYIGNFLSNNFWLYVLYESIYMLSISDLYVLFLVISYITYKFSLNSLYLSPQI